MQVSHKLFITNLVMLFLLVKLGVKKTLIRLKNSLIWASVYL
ncbi:Uncharacterised protein [Mycobacterium tuberculosis]|nr:Uncharacterised protein [Mycobacterium tuberculosis]